MLTKAGAEHDDLGGGKTDRCFQRCWAEVPLRIRAFPSNSAFICPSKKPDS